ncbi:AAA family ATPase, partial [Klebsiella michiganensis]|uniref:AAA family ATPase n=1 Tax=Klebsiella michiganensis TaxID=1134687 RepID=UPI001CC95871
MKRFIIKKLYGYKDIELIFNKRCTIIIAENGAGKTTLINSLNAVLRGDADELRKIRCDSIEIEFKERKYKINISELNYSDFLSFAQLPSQFLKIKEKIKPSLVNDMLHDIKSKPLRELQKKSWYKAAYQATPYGHSELESTILSIKRLLHSYYSKQLGIFEEHNEPSNSSLDFLEEIKNRMRDYDIIYLPTYRRIEKATLREKFSIEPDERVTMQNG